MDRYIGLDAHASSCTVAIVGPSGRHLASHVVEDDCDGAELPGDDPVGKPEDRLRGHDQHRQGGQDVDGLESSTIRDFGRRDYAVEFPIRCNIHLVIMTLVGRLEEIDCLLSVGMDLGDRSFIGRTDQHNVTRSSNHILCFCACPQKCG